MTPVPNANGMKPLAIRVRLSALLIPALLLIASVGCHKPAGAEAHGEEHHHAVHALVVTSPDVRDVISTQQYVCQIHSCRHIEVCALESGYIEPIPVREGQTVGQGDLLFKILPTLYEARYESEVAEAQVAQLEFNNTKKLYEDNVVSQNELALSQARLAKAVAQMELAQAELNFTEVKAPFKGIIDRLLRQQGSLVEEGDVLTTLSDNSVMWAYFNVPEARYLEYMGNLKGEQNNLTIELMLANGAKFPQAGAIGAIEADFDNETGNIAFRADFANPDQLLRHGQTGTVLVSRPTKGAVVIPQRATFEILAKKYVYVVEDEASDDEHHGRTPVGPHGNEHPEHEQPEHLGDKHAKLTMGHGVVRQREITIESEQDDIFLISEGLDANDRIVFEGVRQVRDGDKVEYEYRTPEIVLQNLKFKAE